MNTPGKQIPLRMPLRDRNDFENFYVSDKNEEALMGLRRMLADICDDKATEGQVMLIHGVVHCGRTHLLQAACLQVQQSDHSAFYISSAELLSIGDPTILDGLEDLSLSCIDDIDQLAGNAEWEEAVFHLYNRCKSTGKHLLLSAAMSPIQTAFGLKDLQSRLSAGLIYKLAALSDDDKRSCLVLLSSNLGLDMPAEVVDYILRRSSRDMAVLSDVIQMLDSEALSAGRKLSVPFVKKVMAW